MSEPFLGQIQDFGFNFAPKGWAQCNGQLMQIAQNTALFSLLGTTYGGDGRVTFALPDLRGRTPIHFGQGPGRASYQIGQVGGNETVTLQTSQIPYHNHILRALDGDAEAAVPTNAALTSGEHWNTAAPTTVSSPSSLAPAGTGQGHANMQPTLVVNWCIALQGIYPPRS